MLFPSTFYKLKESLENIKITTTTIAHIKGFMEKYQGHQVSTLKLKLILIRKSSIGGKITSFEPNIVNIA